MQRVALIGYGLEGRSALAYWLAAGAEVTICDKRADLEVPAGAHSQLGTNYLRGLENFDVIVRSPGVPPKVILAENPGVAAKITTTIDEFLRVCPTRNVVGVTGSKGKGTTCTLITEMLRASGKETFLGGNIGISPFDFLPQLTPESYVVLELSSFQLIDITRAPHIAVCLMIVPEHLNWHGDLDEYVGAKANLFATQTAQDVAIYFADSELSHRAASHSPGVKLTYFAAPGAYVENDAIIIDNQELCKIAELKMLGAHNQQNACAAATAVWQMVQSTDAIRSVLTTFSGMEHRIEFVRELDGVRYFDDSFGTTPETATVAMEAFTEPKVMILGGGSKGIGFDGLVEAVLRNNVSQVVIIGTTGPEIAAGLRARGFASIHAGGETMPEMVATARSVSQPGDVVLLSTGCSSFGLFENYKDRGNQFKAAVTKLT